MSKRMFLSLLLAVALFLAAATPVYASGLSGAGTKEDPYRIGSVSDLKQIASHLGKKGVRFILTKDLSLSGTSWTPLGTESKPFRGVLDGNGHSVTGLRFRDGSGENEAIGLFAYASGAEFRNLRITDAVFDCADLRQGGCLAAVAEDCLFFDCDVDVRCQQAAYYFGGLTGYATRSSFENCDATVQLDVSSYSGGLIGCLNYPEDCKAGYVRNCTVSGTISAEGEKIGGLIGDLYADSESEQVGDSYVERTRGHTVYGCEADVAIRSVGDYTMSAVGGLIGCAECVDVSDCRAAGTVEGNGAHLGGLIGEFEGGVGSVTRCSASVDLNARLPSGYGGAVGGLIGWSRGARISDCLATGDVALDANWSNCQDDYMMQGRVWVRYRNPAGALVGLLHFSYSDPKFYLYNCVATGSVSNPRACTEDRSYCAGSLAGYVYDDLMRKYILDKSKTDQTDLSGFSDTVIGRVENNYCVGDLRTYFIPQSDAKRYGNGYVDQFLMPHMTYVTNIEPSALTDRNTFAGLDFSNVWTMTANGPELIRKGNSGNGQSGSPEPPPPPVIPEDKGDLNGDGAVDAVDYIRLKKKILSGNYTAEEETVLDVNGDGDVDARDYIVLKKFVLAGGR